MTIALNNINIGNLPNDGTGDPLRVAFEKLNTNLAVLSGITPGQPDGSIQFNQADTFVGTANIVYDYANNVLNLGTSIVPNPGAIVNLGATTSKIAALYLSGSGMTVGNVTMVESGSTLSFPRVGSPSVMASARFNNLSLDGNITVAGQATVGNTNIGTATLTTIDTTVNQVIYRTPVATFTSGKFQISTTETSGTNVTQTATLVVSKNASNLSANYNAFGTVFTGTSLTQYNVVVAYGNVLVMVSPLLNTTMDHVLSYQKDN
jgi:hypothetical protein